MSSPDIWCELPSIAWRAALDEICFCDHCLDTAACRHCGQWRRDITVRSSLTWAGPQYARSVRERIVLIREWHASSCARLTGLDEGVWRVDLAPVPHDESGGSFEAMEAARTLEIDTRQWPESQWVYRAYGDGEDETFLYVGVTGDVRQRMRQHSRTSEWWPRCDFIALERHSDRTTALAAEAESIRKERPSFNIARRNPAPDTPKDQTA